MTTDSGEGSNAMDTIEASGQIVPSVRNAYWIGTPVGHQERIIYSSAAGSVIDAADPDYAAWLDLGHTPWPWPKDEAGAVTVEALDYGLRTYGLKLTGLSVPTKADLVAFADETQWQLATGGFTIAGRLWATDTTSQGLIAGKTVRLQQPEAPASVRWQFADGFQTIAAPDFIAAAVKVADFVQATFDALDLVLAAIDAGTITTLSGVASAGWPSDVAA